MSDLNWVYKVTNFCAENALDYGDTINTLRRQDDYQLAFRQFTYGASDRVIELLLRKAALDAGLIEPFE